MSSGRYQSRLFNVVHQHSRRLTSQWERTFRHLQVATKWGVEILLYPVYVFLQSADAAVKTLYSQEPPSQPKLSANHSDSVPETPPSVDTPIQRVLEAVQNLPSEDTNVNQLWRSLKLLWSKFSYHLTTNSSSPQALTIPNKTAQSITPNSQNDVFKHQLSLVRGIATDLVNRRLILVSIENEILDILTAQQQSKLSTRINSEIANYFHDGQLPEAQHQKQLLPEIARVLAKLTGNNRVKIPLLMGRVPQDLLDTSKIITSIDTAVAQLEAKTIVPSQEIVKVTQTHINIFLYGKEQLAARGDIAVTADDLETQKFNITALIEAAINYFFGIGSKNLNVRGAKGKLTAQQEQTLSSGNQEQWLNWRDLYGDSVLVAEENTQSTLSINPAVAPNLSTRLSWEKKLPIPPTKSSSSLVKNKKQPRHLARMQKKSGKVITRQQIETAISPLRSDSESIEISPQHLHQEELEPDWIETKATSVGYEKHPLEQALELLDRAMLWLEEKIVQIFHALQSLWRGK